MRSAMRGSWAVIRSVSSGGSQRSWLYRYYRINYGLRYAKVIQIPTAPIDILNIPRSWTRGDSAYCFRETLMRLAVAQRSCASSPRRNRRRCADRPRPYAARTCCVCHPINSQHSAMRLTHLILWITKFPLYRFAFKYLFGVHRGLLAPQASNFTFLTPNLQGIPTGPRLLGAALT